MEIEITKFVIYSEPFDFSHSQAEGGENAGKNTWRNAMKEARESPLLKTDEELDALKHWANETGAWDEDETATWSPEHCNALFIQLVSGDLREMGFDEVNPEDFNWEDYETQAQAGQISGRIFKCEPNTGEIHYFYSLD